MRRLALFLTVAVLAPACDSRTAQETTTTVAVEEPSTSTTTMETTTTTVVGTTATVAEGPVEICQATTVIWRAGETYAASCFALPWLAVAPGDGWRAPLIDESSMLVSWIDPAGPNSRVNVAVVIGRYLESMASIEGLDEIESGLSEVAGRDAEWVDFEGEPYPPTPSIPTGCAADGSGGVLIRGDRALGYRVAPAPGRGDFFGVGACDVARIWVLEVDGRTVTILGGTADPGRHAEAVAKIEELFEGMSFDIAAGS